METPEQRVLVRFGTVEGAVGDSSGAIFLRTGAHITPGSADMADLGHLKFSCPVPLDVKDESDGRKKRIGDVTDFDPIRIKATFLYRAFQLGHENRTDDLSQISDFQARYTDFQTQPDAMEMAYPVENVGGLLGFRSLAPCETTIVEFALHNFSNQEFGELSKTKRSLFAHVYYADDHDRYEIPIEKVTVRAEDAQIVDVSPRQSAGGGKGYRYVIRSLPAGRDFTIQLSLKLNSAKIEAAEKVGLQCDLYLQYIPLLEATGDDGGTTTTSITERKKIRLIQRRLFVASCQPRFVPDSNCDVVLVTTNATEAGQVKAWKTMLNKLGLTFQPYSLSRYGHIDPRQAVEDTKLKEALKNKLVIVLNDQYVPKPNIQGERLDKCYPSQLLKSVYEYDDTTQFLVVGGKVDHVQHLAPSEVATNTDGVENESYANAKNSKAVVMENLAKERESGISQARSQPIQFDVNVKVRSLFAPKKLSTLVENRARKLCRWLQAKDPLRSYSVEWSSLEESVQVSDKGRLSPRQIGNLHVYVSPPRSQSTITLVEEEQGTGRGIVASPATVCSRSMMFATMQAASFSVKMACYCRHMRKLSSSKSDEVVESKVVVGVIKDCLVNDFVQDISNYYHGRMKVPEHGNRSPLLRQLRQSEALNSLLHEAIGNADLGKVLTRELSLLVGALQCTANAKDLCRWWNPLGRKHRSRCAIIQALDHLMDRWKDVLDEALIREHCSSLDELVRQTIQERKKSRWAMLGIRGRYRAALVHLHSPRNVDAYQQTFRTLRVRRECELMTGETMKVKKCTSRSLDPTTSSRALSRRRSQTSYRQTVRDITASEFALYVRTDNEEA
jgi:hypothetical protein